MKIEHVYVKEDESSISLVGDCVIRHFGHDTIYFKFEKPLAGDLLPDFAPFAACLLIPSMRLGEDLIIEGPISPQLYQGMQQIMKIMTKWELGLKEIAIRPKELLPDTGHPTQVASFFSGGVDSFYTYLRHKDDGAEAISTLISVNGFDIDLRNVDLWRTTKKNILTIAEKESVCPIFVESNVQPLLEPFVPWDYTHGGCLAAVALCLRHIVKTVYIASSYHVSQLIPWGSHPMLDYLWSTETLQIIHDGAEALRVDKVIRIAQSDVVLQNLRVCYRNVNGQYNCGTCDKCLRTMIGLKIANVLDRCATFPHTIDLSLAKALQIEGDHGALFHQENLERLEALGIEPELQAILKERLANVQNSPNPGAGLISAAMFYDHVYLRGATYSVYSRLRHKYS